MIVLIVLLVIVVLLVVLGIYVVPQQRQAIIDLGGTGLSSEQIMSVILANQYIDVLNGFAASPNAKVIFSDGQPTGIEGVRNNIISALEAQEPMPNVIARAMQQ